MSIEVVMPQMGESIAEGTVTRWIKKVGDQVERDEPLFEISTDKVDTEVPAPAAGTLATILVEEGQTVPVGTVVATLAAGEARSESPPPTAKSQTVPSKPQQTPASTSDGGGGHFKATHELITFQRKSRQPTQPRRATPIPAEQKSQLSPAVLALAAQHQLPMDELVRIQGTGAAGRITKKDVQRHLDGHAAAPAPASPSTEVPQEYLYRPGPDDTVVPLSPMRKKIADHMSWSQRISAHVTSFNECDMHRIALHRDKHRSSFEAAEGFSLSYLPFVAEAAVKAISDFPIFNASMVADQIVMKKPVHLGVAVMLEHGLIVPVIRNAEKMNYVGLARAIHDVSTRARSKQLAVEEVQGGTFTITNPGMFGGLTGTPMIDQPQVAILGLGAVQKKPVVIDDAIAIRPIMVLALTFDHRIIDGATGFQFIERVRSYLESFEF